MFLWSLLQTLVAPRSWIGVGHNCPAKLTNSWKGAFRCAELFLADYVSDLDALPWFFRDDAPSHKRATDLRLIQPHGVAIAWVLTLETSSAAVEGESDG